MENLVSSLTNRHMQEMHHLFMTTFALTMHNLIETSCISTCSYEDNLISISTQATVVGFLF